MYFIPMVFTFRDKKKNWNSLAKIKRSFLKKDNNYLLLQ